MLLFAIENKMKQTMVVRRSASILIKDKVYLKLSSFNLKIFAPIENKVNKLNTEAITINIIGTTILKSPASLSAENACYLVIGEFSRSSH